MITQIVHNWVLPDKLEEARDFFLENSEVARTIPGFITRQVLQSQSDPLEWVTSTTWRDLEAARAYRNSPERLFDTYGEGSTIPPQSEFFKKHGPQVTFRSRAAVATSFEVVPES